MKTVRSYKSLLIRAHNDEHYQFHYWIVTVLGEKISAVTNLQAGFNAYKALFDHEDEIFKRSTEQEGTEVITALDYERDQLLISLRHLVDAIARNAYSDKQADALAVQKLLRVYKGVEKKNYMANTANVINFVQDTRSDAYAAHIEALGLKPEIDKLEAANLAFDEAYNERMDWLGAQGGQGTMKEVRPQVDEAFGVLAFGLESLYQANELGAKDPAVQTSLGTLIDQINNRLNQMARIRNSRTHSGSTGNGSGNGNGNGDGGEEKPDESLYIGMRQPVITTDGLMYIEAQNKPAFDEFVKEHFTLTAEGKGVMFIEKLPNGTKQKYFYPFKSFEGDLDENMQPVTIGLNFSPREGYVFQSPFTEDVLANPYVCYLYAATDKLVAVFPDEKKPREIKFNK